jgi:hypothetical protein
MQSVGALTAAVAGFRPNQQQTTIDLSVFCDVEAGSRYDLTKPFSISRSVYATDGRILVCQSTLLEHSGEDERLVPDFDKLLWSRFDKETNWKKYPKFNSVEHHTECSECPECENGLVDPVPCCLHKNTATFDSELHWCNRCADYYGCYGKPCDRCKGQGYLAEAVAVDERRIALHYDKKIRTLPGLEYLPTPAERHNTIGMDAIPFRFHGGKGFICGLKE